MIGVLTKYVLWSNVRIHPLQNLEGSNKYVDNLELYTNAAANNFRSLLFEALLFSLNYFVV